VILDGISFDVLPGQMKIVLGAGYHSYVGIEYEGDRLSEPEGIRATKKLLERLQSELK